MDKFFEVVAAVNSAINGVVWGWPMIILILGTGILLTIRTKALLVTSLSLLALLYINLCSWLWRIVSPLT